MLAVVLPAVALRADDALLRAQADRREAERDSRRSEAAYREMEDDYDNARRRSMEYQAAVWSASEPTVNLRQDTEFVMLDTAFRRAQEERLMAEAWQLRVQNEIQRTTAELIARYREIPDIEDDDVRAATENVADALAAHVENLGVVNEQLQRYVQICLDQEMSFRGQAAQVAALRQESARRQAVQRQQLSWTDPFAPSEHDLMRARWERDRDREELRKAKKAEERAVNKPKLSPNPPNHSEK